jgi:hypothetical protein
VKSIGKNTILKMLFVKSNINKNAFFKPNGLKKGVKIKNSKVKN